MRGNDPSVSESLRIYWDSQRDRAAQIYAFAVPNKQALQAFKKHESNGIIELGAGTGYWANYLQKNGVDVKPFDICPPGVRSYMN